MWHLWCSSHGRPMRLARSGCLRIRTPLLMGCTARCFIRDLKFSCTVCANGPDSALPVLTAN